MEIARREPFSIMSGRKRPRPRPLEILRQRFQAELVAVRRLLAEAHAVLPASSPSAPRVRVCPAEEPPAKKRKASPLPVPVKKMTSEERSQLYADLTKLAKLSESHRRGLCGDYIEIEMHAVQDATLVEMQKQLDNFLRESKNPSTHHQHKQTMAQEEDEDVDIVGGVSPLPVRPTPVKLVEEDEEYVDICGDASPVKNLGEDATISGSDSGSSHQSVDSRPAPAERAANTTPPTRDLIARANEILERRRKEETSRAREKARQELLETERAAMPKDTLDEDVKALGIDQHNTARPNNLLRQIGLFLKVDDDDMKQQQQSFEEDLEEGEIRL
uniref:NET domain-containing protein n=1 Tax=Aegilops tauschii TaxID=37682 RepID=R7VZI7_AEGTA